MAEGPQPYPVVYDAPSGSLQYVFQSGQVTIPEASVNAITALTGDVVAAGPGSVAVTLAASVITGKLITGFVSGAGTVAATDTILQAINKLNGNIAATVIVANAALPATGGALTGAVSITGTAQTGLTTPQTGVKMWLDYNATGNRQIMFGDGAYNASFNAIRFQFVSGAAVIDSITQDGVTTEILQLGNSKGVQITGPLIQPVTAVAGTGTVTPTAAQKTISIPVSGNVTLNGPTGGYDGQPLTIRVVNDGSHAVSLATGSGNYSFGTTITSYTNSVSLIDYIGVIYKSAATIWHVVSLSQGF